MSRKNEKSLNDSLNEHAKRLREQEAAAAPTESEQVVAAPAEDAQIEAPASQREALTAAQEKALAALQKCLVAIQNKLRAAYADAKRDSDPRVAEILRTVVESLKEKRLDEILLNGILKIPTDYTKHPPIIGMELKFAGVTEAWAEVISTVQADAKSLYPDISDKKFKKLVQRNTSAYKQLLGSAVQNTFASPQTPDLVAVARNARAQRAEGPTNPEQVDKATGAAAQVNENKQGEAERMGLWKSFLRGLPSRIVMSSLMQAIFVTFFGASVTLGLPFIIGFFASPVIAYYINKIGGEGAHQRKKFLLTILASVLLVALTGETVQAAGVDPNSVSVGGLFNSTWSFFDSHTTALGEYLDAPRPEVNMDILSDPDFDPGDKVTLRDTKLTFLIGPNGETSLTDYDPNAPTKSADELNNYKDAVRFRDATAPPAPTIVQERIPMEMPPRADAPAIPEATTGTAEAPTQPAPAPAEAPAQPTATGAETVAPPAEIGPVFAGGDEGMVSILERLREQVQQAAEQGATFPEGSLADQLLKADSQADLIKIAQDNGWFNTVADTAGTPDSVVIYENDQFAINNDGELVAPKDFESRGMTDTGDYTPKGTIQRS